MGNDDKTRRDKDRLSTFLKSFPTQINCTANKGDPQQRVFWTQHQTNNSSSVVSDLHDKIKSAFSDVDLSELLGIIQFWAADAGRRLLSTENQPFSFNYLHPLRHKYRLCSLKYQYSIDDNENNKVEVENKDEAMIISGAPTVAFLNGFPEVVLDSRRVLQQNPLVRCALECGLTSSLLLPVFIHPSSSSCVGVVECSVKRSGLVIFSSLKSALERAGVTTYNVQDSRPYKSICSLKRAPSEIEDALQMVCESHDLPLAQVWIAFQNDKHVPTEDTQTKQMSAFKFIGYRDVSDAAFSPTLDDYYLTCDTLPLKFGEGLVGKTLQTYQPHFSRNTYQLTGDNRLLAVLSANTRCSCFAICLRSTETGDVDYAFEFLWPKTRNYLILLESLLSTLKSCLPSFKLASGAQLSHDILVLDVDSSSRNKARFFKTLKGNKLSYWKRCSNCPGTSEWQGPKFAKRKLSDLYPSQADSNQQDLSTNINSKTYMDDDDDDDDDDDVLVAATYREKFKVFHLLSSSKLADLKEKIGEEFNLDPGTCKLQFESGKGCWAWLNKDADLAICIDHFWRHDQMSPIEVRMLYEENGCADQNSG